MPGAFWVTSAEGTIAAAAIKSGMTQESTPVSRGLLISRQLTGQIHEGEKNLLLFWISLYFKFYLMFIRFIVSVWSFTLEWTFILVVCCPSYFLVFLSSPFFV